MLCASACFSVHFRGSGGTATFCEQGFQQSGARPVLSTCTSDGAVLGPGGMLRGRGMSRGCPRTRDVLKHVSPGVGLLTGLHPW